MAICYLLITFLNESWYTVTYIRKNRPTLFKYAKKSAPEAFANNYLFSQQTLKYFGFNGEKWRLILENIGISRPGVGNPTSAWSGCNDVISSNFD